VCMVWSRDSRCTTNVEGHKVECQGRDMKTRSTKNLWLMVMIPFERLQAVELVSLSVVEAVIVNAC